MTAHRPPVKNKDSRAAIGYRPTWAEINLDNLAFNFRQIRKRVDPATRVLVTVKADAYGHGLIPVSRRLVACGVDYLGVASIDEGIRIREAGIKVPVLVLGMVLGHDIGPLFEHDLIPTVCGIELGRALDRFAKRARRRIRVHVKIDTGMGRLGVLHQDAFKLVKSLHGLKSVEVEGLFTHFAFADLDENFTRHQLRLFNGLVAELNEAGIRVPLLHSANSMGLVNFRESHFNMVRPGIIVYGLRPSKDIGLPLKPVLSLKTRVVYRKKVPKGFGVSYGHAYVTGEATNIVNLPIGYGDGYPRNLSNLSPVLIRGKAYKICGRICMDQILVDVGADRVKVGDEVVLIGAQGKKSVSAEALANLSGTIPYEIVCGLGGRIPRVYV